MSLRFAIVGCGKIAGNHARALSQVPGVDVIGCCDAQSERAREFARLHGIPHAYGSVEELLELRPDAVTVCTPHPVHEQVVVAAARAGHNLGNRVTVIGETGAAASVLEYPEGHEGVNEIWTVPGESRFAAPFLGDGAVCPDIADINSALSAFHTVQVQDFADAVRTGRAPAVTGRDARISLAIVAAIYESARTGGVVDLTGELEGVPS